MSKKQNGIRVGRFDRQVNVRLSPKLSKRLEDALADSELTQSQIIRMALVFFLKHNEKKLKDMVAVVAA